MRADYAHARAGWRAARGTAAVRGSASSRALDDRSRRARARPAAPRADLWTTDRKLLEMREYVEKENMALHAKVCVLRADDRWSLESGASGS